MDRIGAAVRSRNMAAIKSKDTAPEMVVRRLLRSLGFRGYRLHRKDIPGRPDIAFVGRRKAILVHGCYWHRHSCKLAHAPRSRLEYWGPKLERNAARDAAALAALDGGGWGVLVVWECETKDTDGLKARLAAFMEQPRPIAICSL